MEEAASVNFVQVIIVGMLLMFAFTIMVIFFVLIYQRKLTNAKLKMQEIELKQERQLLHNSFRVQEHERKIFAANLHDEIGAQVSLTKMTVSSIPISETNKKTVENSLNLLNDIAHSIRSISYNLLPPSLERFGLNTAIREFIQKIEAQETNINFQEFGEEQLTEEEKLQLFRIVQEGLHNALKYAQARKIDVSISHHQGKAKVMIKDDGIGFSREDTSGLGLLNMKHRAEMIHYLCQIESNDTGTTLYIEPKINEK